MEHVFGRPAVYQIVDGALQVMASGILAILFYVTEDARDCRIDLSVEVANIVTICLALVAGLGCRSLRLYC
jgi:hypothetical protein